MPVDADCVHFDIKSCAVSILSHAKTVPYEQLLKTVGMLNLRDRRIRQSLILLYKCFYCSGPHTFVTFSIIGELTTV